MKRSTEQTLGTRLNALFFENGSYKLVALFVTLILWITIIGRRDTVISKEMELEFLLPRGMAVKEATIERRVTVEVSGPRMALKRFKQNPGAITIDLSKFQAGPVRMAIAPRSVEVPSGVRVLAVSPEVITLTLVHTDSENGGER